ncbi:MAG: adenosylcobinamide-GDP ribazoletransferase [Desulfobacterales bacterium]|nr:adenosylcobinamide-GDP ribazoletransferase [Desulfobacterales bacterium]
MVPWFPAVGLLLGALLALFDLAAARLLEPVTAAAVLDVVLLAVLTGAFHLDGLGDTADGLFSHRPRERMLEIMKDSRIGAMGVVAVVPVLAVKWAGISGLSATPRRLLLILVPAYARCGILLRHAGSRLRPARRRHGPCLFQPRSSGSRDFWALCRAGHAVPGPRAAGGLARTIGFVADRGGSSSPITAGAWAASPATCWGRMAEVDRSRAVSAGLGGRPAMIGGHGGNIYELRRRLGCSPADIVDLSSNVNPLGPPPGLCEFLGGSMDADHGAAGGRQPRHHPELRRECLGVSARPPARRATAPPSSSTRLPGVLTMKKALIVGPTYSDYADACRLHGVAPALFSCAWKS